MHYLILFLMSTTLTGLMAKYAKHFGLIDQPNRRKTHVIPTPRGGGLAIVLTTMLMLFHVIFLPALGIALMGFWDDLKNLSAKSRFFIQFVFAMIALMAITHFQSLQIWGIAVPAIFLVFLIVWFTNLYNFMDGINGIAALEAIFVALGMVFLQAHYTDIWLGLACSCFGFLIWNFPKAKIFMGDVGSQFIGFMFASLMLMESTQSSQMLIVGFILFGVFIVDASVTLITRIVTKQQFLAPHRSHTYQILWKKLDANHTRVSFLMLFINIFWLFPWAYVVSYQRINSCLGLLISYAPLVIISLLFKAGRLTS